MEEKLKNRAGTELIILLDSSLNLNEIKNFVKNEVPAHIITLDYYSHELLLSNKIPHQTSDHYLENNELEMLQKRSQELSQWSTQNQLNNLIEYRGINIAHLFYREFQYHLLPLMKKFFEILKIIQKYPNSKFVTSSNLYEILKKQTNLVTNTKSSQIPEEKFLNDSIKYSLNFGNLGFSLNISRKKYRSLKKLSDKVIHKLFGPKNADKIINTLLVEFDPIKYKKLFLESKNFDTSLLLYNRRRPSIWNKSSFSIIKNSNTKILTPSIFQQEQLKHDISKGIQQIKHNLELIWKNENFFEEYFTINQQTFWYFLKPLLKKLIDSRIEEAITEIELAKRFFDQFHVDVVIVLNESGFNEQIILKFAREKNIPIFLSSHGLSYETFEQNYRERRIFDGVDPILSDKFLLWGEKQLIFAKNYGIDSKKIEIIGSPVHDDIFEKKFNTKPTKDFVLLATSSPTNSMVNDLTVNTIEKYEKAIETICKTVIKQNKKIILKLHPFQEELDVTNLVKKIDSKIQVVKSGDIISLIHDCDIFVTIDVSTTILEAQILSKPVISVLIKDYGWGAAEIFSSKSCLSVRIEEFENTLLRIMNDEQFKNKLIQSGKQFINQYFSYQGQSSKQLFKLIKESKN